MVIEEDAARQQARNPRQRAAHDAGEVLPDRIIALQRRGAKPPRPRADPAAPSRQDAAPPRNAQPGLIARPPPQQNGNVRSAPAPGPGRMQILRRGAPPPDADFTRNRQPSRGHGELYDHRDKSPAPAVRIYKGEEQKPAKEEEAEAPRRAQASGSGGSRQLFDPGRHDPVRFSSSSQSQTSSNGRTRKSKMHSYPPSSGSQSSAADDSSAEAPKDATDAKDVSESTPNVQSAPVQQRANPLVETFRRAYRHITELEAARMLEAEQELKLRDEKPDDWVRDEVITAAAPAGPTKDDKYWLDAINKHKQLADAYHSFLELASDPRLPASLHTLPQKYNIPTRLWQHAFYPMLQRLRRALPASSQESAIAADLINHLTEFIYYAYSFYTWLLEEPTFSSYRPAWLEQLGDLARYRMLIAGIVVKYHLPSSASNKAFAESLPQMPRKKANGDAMSDTRDSVNSLSLDAWDVEEQDTWRSVAREWYAKGLAETPGTGRLHHHLGLLCKGDDFRALYHFVRSLTTSHPYISARESIRPTLEAPEDRARRVRADAKFMDLFVHLHSMLFTRIALDDFDEVHARFLERFRNGFLQLSRASVDSPPFKMWSDVQWAMSGVINVASLLQYGLEDSPLKRALVRKEPALTDAKPAEEAEDLAPNAIMLNPVVGLTPGIAQSDGGGSEAGSESGRLSPPSQQMRIMSLNECQSAEAPVTFVHAARVTFDLLAHFCRHSYSPLAGQSKAPKPYLTVVFTFLMQVVQQPTALELLERHLPWTAMIELFNRIPKGNEIRLDPQAKLTGHPLPEDWLLRGSDWTGRHVFGRGYWKASAKAAKDSPQPESEIDVLNIEYEPSVAAQHAQSADAGYGGATDEALALGRWKRIAQTASWFLKCVPGLAYDQTHGRFKIVGVLQQKLLRWTAEEQSARKEAEKLRLAKEASARARVEAVEDPVEEGEVSEGDDEQPGDTPEVKQLKARRRELRRIINEAKARSSGSKAVAASSRAPLAAHRKALRAVPGFTVLVFDTNILLNALPLFTSLLESKSWTIIVPLAVVTELDGLTKNLEVGKQAKKAVLYLEAHLKAYGLYLKVQTSRGNYLVDLAIRSEALDLSGSGDGPRNLDDVILRAAVWQGDHFVDRSSLLGVHRVATETAAKVSLVTFDRNLRVKARAGGVDVVGDADLERLVLQTQPLARDEADKG